MQHRDVILILSASAGSGHMIAARALEHAFRAQRPDADVEVVDALAISNPLFRRLYADGYTGLVRHAPTAMGWLYDAMDRPNGRLQDLARVWIQNFNKLPLVRYVRQRKPDLIVHTHFLPAEVVAQMRRAGRFDCPQATVTTDFETHRLWVQEPTERYYTATAEGRAYLETFGAARARVRITGIPVRPGFAMQLGRDAARQRCELDPAGALVLVLAGGFSGRLSQQLVQELVAMPNDAQVVINVGRNAALGERLLRQTRDAQRMVRVIGYTDRMHEWMRAADLVVTKPGGLTVSEALACGLPLVVMNPIPGQETRNSDHLLERGAAIKVNNPRLLGFRVASLLADSQRLATLRQAAQDNGRPHAARDIVADLADLLDSPPV
jgi:processive 1,2-diacylglycerol beta-glucosyltransferase